MHRAVFRAAMLRAQHGLDRLWENAAVTPRLIHSDLTPSNVLRSRGRLAVTDAAPVVVTADPCLDTRSPDSSGRCNSLF